MAAIELSEDDLREDFGPVTVDDLDWDADPDTFQADEDWMEQIDACIGGSMDRYDDAKPTPQLIDAHEAVLAALERIDRQRHSGSVCLLEYTRALEKFHELVAREMGLRES